MACFRTMLPNEPQPEPGPAGGADTVEAHEELRPPSFSIAYRMTGSVGDAEDIVQEAFIRAYRAEAACTLLESPRAFLATTTTRLAIDQLRSARVRRESYVGTWLPEPLVADSEPGPAERAEMSDSLSLAFLGAAGEPVAGRTGRVPAARGVRLRIPGRSPGPWPRARPAAARSLPGPGTASRRGRPRFAASRAQGMELVDRFLECGRRRRPGAVHRDARPGCGLLRRRRRQGRGRHRPPSTAVSGWSG